MTFCFQNMTFSQAVDENSQKKFLFTNIFVLKFTFYLNFMKINYILNISKPEAGRRAQIPAG